MEYIIHELDEKSCFTLILTSSEIHNLQILSSDKENFSIIKM